MQLSQMQYRRILKGKYTLTRGIIAVLDIVLIVLTDVRGGGLGLLRHESVGTKTADKQKTKQLPKQRRVNTWQWY